MFLKYGFIKMPFVHFLNEYFRNPTDMSNNTENWNSDYTNFYPYFNIKLNKSVLLKYLQKWILKEKSNR